MRIFVGAGEASGDRILAALMRSLRTRHPDAVFRGFGGPLCAAEGLASLVPFEALAVNGVSDVLRRAPALLRARARLGRALEVFMPDLVLLVDYPGMNVALARRARRRGIPVHYVAPPQLWAYRRPAGRLRRLRAALEDAAGGVSLQVLFPFEADAYHVGAPWRGPILQGHFFDLPAFEPARGLRLLLCPGSRAGVLRRNLPLWLARVRAYFGTLEGVDVLVPPHLEALADALCASEAGVASGAASSTGGPEIITDKETAFARAGTAVAFPGTITLELFLQRIPVRVWAVLDAPTFHLGRLRLAEGPLALPSRIAGAPLLPEWIGTARDFARRPPEIPDDVAAWSSAAQGAEGATAVHEVWSRMGAADGAETGAAACLDLISRRAGV